MKAYQYGNSQTLQAKRRNESACTLDELLDGAILVLWTNCLTELFHFRELNLLQVMATWAHNQRGYSVLETCLSASYHSSTYGVVAGSGRRVRPRQFTTVGLGRVFQKEESRVETEQSDGSLGE